MYVLYITSLRTKVLNEELLTTETTDDLTGVEKPAVASKHDELF